MQTELSPSLTRLDAVLWFLRVELWICLFALIFSFIQPYFVQVALFSIQNWVGLGIPVVVLLLFPKVLATSALGVTATEPLTTTGLRSLAFRCVGLALLVAHLGSAVTYSFYVLYSFVPFVSSAWLFGSGIGLSFIRAQIIATALRFLLGFFLAFGPAIRDNFRAR